MVDPDPIDRAYSQAESLLHDQAERSARRARVLAAIAQDAVIRPISRPMSRFASRGGWLVAASVLVAAGFLAVRFLPLNQLGSSPAQAPVAKSVQKNQMTAALSPPVPAINQSEAASSGPKTKALDQPAARALSESSSERMDLAAPPPPPAKAAPPPRAFPMAVPPAAVSAPAMAAPPPAVAARSAPFPAPAPPPMADMAKPMGEPGSNLAFDQLRAAAAAGRTIEVQELLSRQIPVDVADANGETALMKSIRADQPATAALLIRHGASLDKKNSAGLSARDLAAQINDPALNHALGLER